MPWVLAYLMEDGAREGVKVKSFLVAASQKQETDHFYPKQFPWQIIFPPPLRYYSR